MARPTRRHIVAGAGPLLAGLRVAIDPAFAQALVPLRWAALTPGFTVLPVQYVLANKLGGKHGIKLDDPTAYTAVSTYYNDFVAGNYDVCIGSWDTFASRYLAGVPIRYLCTITTAEMIAVLAPKGGITELPQIKGKVFAGLQSTGTYRMFKALVREVYGFDIEKDATVQSVDNPAATVTAMPPAERPGSGTAPSTSRRAGSQPASSRVRPASITWATPAASATATESSASTGQSGSGTAREAGQRSSRQRQVWATRAQRVAASTCSRAAPISAETRSSSSSPSRRR